MRKMSKLHTFVVLAYKENDKLEVVVNKKANEMDMTLIYQLTA